MNNRSERDLLEQALVESGCSVETARVAARYVAGMVGTIGEIQEDLSGLHYDVAVLSADVRQLNRDVAALRTDVSYAQDQISSLEYKAN